MKKYAGEYTHNYKRWAFDFWAENWEDAQDKLDSIKHSAKIVGAFEPDETVSPAEEVSQTA